MSTITETARSLLASQVLFWIWGNLSEREDASHFLITPRQGRFESMEESDLIRLELSEKGSNDPRASLEQDLHASIYYRFPEAAAVVHAHSTYASALSLGKQSYPLPEELATRLGSPVLPCAPYALPGSRSLSRRMLRSLEQSGARATLLEGHGFIVYAGSPEECGELAIAIEAFARDFYQVQVGSDFQGERLFSLYERSHGAMFRTDYHRSNGSRVIDQPRHAIFFDQLSPVLLLILRQRPDVRAVIADPDPLFHIYAETDLRPYLNDYAELVGSKADSSPRHNVILASDAAYAMGRDIDEAQAVLRTLQNNALAEQLATQRGNRPLPPFPAWLIRQIFRQKYARLSR